MNKLILTDEIVLQLRKLVNSGMSLTRAMDELELDCSYSTAWCAAHRKTWRHLP